MVCACCSVTKHQRRELDWFWVLVLLWGFGRTGNANPAVQHCFSASHEYLSVGSPGSPTQALLYVRETNSPGFCFSLYLLLIFRTKQINLNHDRKICWASGLDSASRLTKSQRNSISPTPVPSTGTWEGPDMFFQWKNWWVQDPWGAAAHCDPQQIPAARVSKGELGCAALQVQEFSSAPVLLCSNSSSPQFLPCPVLLHFLPYPDSSSSIRLKITKKSWS